MQAYEEKIEEKRGLVTDMREIAHELKLER